MSAICSIPTSSDIIRVCFLDNDGTRHDDGFVVDHVNPLHLKYTLEIAELIYQCDEGDLQESSHEEI